MRRGRVDLRSKQIEGPASEVLLCQAKPCSDILILPKRISRHDPAARKTITANVFRITRAADDVFTLMLRFPAGIRARFKAGQYLRVQMPDGDTRNFSMANAPRESDGVQLHIRRIPGGQFSEGVLASSAKGRQAQRRNSVRRILSAHRIRQADRLPRDRHRLCADQIHHRGSFRARKQPPVRLYWGGRRRQDLYLANLADKWVARAPWLTFIPVLSEPDADWRGATGLVHEAVLRDIPDMSGWQVYACGNPAMIRSAERDFHGPGGLPDGQFFADPFVASGNPDPAERPDNHKNACGVGSNMTIVRNCSSSDWPSRWRALDGRADAADAPPDFPNHTVRIIVPFPAGGTADVLPRIIAQYLSKRWNQPVVVENKSGAGGNIGAAYVASSPADGYTLLASPPGPLAINQSLYKPESLGFKPTEMEPVTVLGAVPNVLDVRPGFPAKTAQELIAYAKANPGKVSFASQGNGSTSHLTGILFQKLTGTQMVHIPYRGTTPALQDIMASQVDLFFDNLGSSLSLQQGDKLRILATGGAKRNPLLPDVPTLEEAGVASFESSTWFAVVAPAQTPPAIVQFLNREITEVLALPEVKEQFAKIAVEPVGGSVADTAKFLAGERDKWRGVVQSADIAVE